MIALPSMAEPLILSTKGVAVSQNGPGGAEVATDPPPPHHRFHLQVGLSEEDLTMMMDEASKAGPSRAGVDEKTYFSVMKSCTLF